jgi:hypothetical protein
MPAGVFLLGDEETKGIRSRVGRLIVLAATERRTGSRHAVLTNLFTWAPVSMLLVVFGIAATNPYLLSRVHYLIEHAVFVLR